MLPSLVWLIPLLPLLAAGWIGLCAVVGWYRGERGERPIARLAFAAVLFPLLLLLLLDVSALLRGVPGQLVFGSWFASGEYRVQLSFTLDALGLSLATLVALICLATLGFSVDYMHREAGFQRFFMLLSLFSGAMLLVVLAGNAVLAFVGWELAGVSSYLLIGYAFERKSAVFNATRAFVTNRVGDAGFILGIALSLLWLGTVEWPQMAIFSREVEPFSKGLIALGFLFAALAKSAQLPFSPWIARALEGPTPSSALFYGSLMVHAGVYLVTRLEPLFSQVNTLLLLMGLLGLLTALYGWLVGLVQTDIKSSLIFSTNAQVGLMFLECGLGWFELAAWHLGLHAVWRSYQFLHAPALLQLVSEAAREVPAWLRRWPRLHAAALQRFWLDAVADWLLVRPTRSLAEDLQDFDQRVVTRMVGLPDQSGSLNSLARWELLQQGRGDADTAVGRGRGMAGRLLEWLARVLYWFEEHLVLQGAGEGLKQAIDALGGYLKRVEELLSQPRYLMLLIMATFTVII
ncbi:MAG TPA: proton-conducting transporter membrane subunit [Gammaproteobacteria bacterium]|nr:proton-conducting transporter membrane subunit [Gammaproteobacteria bacterium]